MGFDPWSEECGRSLVSRTTCHGAGRVIGPVAIPLLPFLFLLNRFCETVTG